MDNEENINENSNNNSTSDSSVNETPTEESNITADNPSSRTTYGNRNNVHNRIAAGSDRLANNVNNMKNKMDRLNQRAKKMQEKNPNSRVGKMLDNFSSKAGNRLNNIGNKLGGINKNIQRANNVANAAEDPLGTAKDVAVDKAKAKAGETAKKAADAVKEKTEKAVKKAGVKVALGPVIAFLLATIIIIFLALIAVSFFYIIIAGAYSNENDNNNVASSGECGFSISETSLTRDEFIEAIKNYSSSHSISKDFVDNAGAIYDKSIEKGRNPEVVIVRAIAESGANSTSASYNYWGMGCSNTGGGADCHSYSNFMAGVDEFLDNISKYSSLTDMMSKYSYLGDYWYNPGDAGTGGCYYANIIYENPPTRVKTACSSSNICSESKCVKTTAEEREQYTKWQVEKNMASIRKKVFGLDSTEGVSCDSENNGSLVELSTYTEGRKGLKMLTSSLSSSQINELNNYIKTSVDKSGYGTGAGVAAAGQSLVEGMRQFGYYLPYYWGGGHGDGAAQIGVSSYLGTKGLSCSDRSGICYHYHSFDCSGFVSWSIKNGCKKSFTAVTASTFNSKKFGKVIDVKDAKPGDIMASSGHVILVVKNNGDGTVMTAHSTGSSDEGNIVFVKRNGSDSHKARDMSKWYKDNCDKSR